MTTQEILAEIREDHVRSSESYDFDDSDYLEEYEAEGWSDEGKYSYRQVVYWSKKHNVYIAVNESRSGSYFTDYYYDLQSVDVVEKHERVVTQKITEWLTV
jgi:hypothetical protein